MNPKVSIITANFNYENYIRETIESVINQSYENWEMIIVDDGSTDNSVNIIKEYCQKDSRIKLFTHPNNENRGLGETIQLGLSKSNTDYIVFLESDDTLKENYLCQKFKIFDTNPHVGFLYNNIQFIGDKRFFYNKYLKKINNYWKKNNKPHCISDILHLDNYIPTFSCVMLKKDLLNDCNFYPPRMAFLDYWLWAQICTKTDFYYTFEKLSYWRKHSESYIQKDTTTNLKTYEFYNQLYQILPPIKNIKYKILFLNKLFRRFCKYKLNL